MRLGRRSNTSGTGRTGVSRGVWGNGSEGGSVAKRLFHLRGRTTGSGSGRTRGGGGGSIRGEGEARGRSNGDSASLSSLMSASNVMSRQGRPGQRAKVTQPDLEGVQVR